MNMQRQFTVKVNPTGLSTGVHFAEVRAAIRIVVLFELLSLFFIVASVLVIVYYSTGTNGTCLHFSLPTFSFDKSLS